MSVGRQTQAELKRGDEHGVEGRGGAGKQQRRGDEKSEGGGDGMRAEEEGEGMGGEDRTTWRWLVPEDVKESPEDFDKQTVARHPDDGSGGASPNAAATSAAAPGAATYRPLPLRSALGLCSTHPRIQQHPKDFLNLRKALHGA